MTPLQRQRISKRAAADAALLASASAESLANFNRFARALALVCAHFKVTPAELESREKTERLQWPRLILLGLARRHTTYTLDKLALLFNRTEQAMSYGRVALENRLQTSCKAGRQFAALESQLVNRKSQIANSND